MSEPEDWLPRCPGCDRTAAEYQAELHPLYLCVCPDCSARFWVEAVPVGRKEKAAVPAGDFLPPTVLAALKRRRKGSR